MAKHLQRSFLFFLFYGILFSGLAQNAPGGFGGTASGTTITLNWTPEDGDVNNEGYVIKAKRNPGGAFPATPTRAEIVTTFVNDADMTDNVGMIKVTNISLGTYNAFTNLVAGARYDFEIYTYDNNSVSGAASTTVYTLATAPGAYPGGFTFTATTNGNQIDLAFTNASKLPLDAHGYILLRRNGSNPTLGGVTDGSTTPSDATYYLATISDSTSAAAGTTYTDNTAVAGVTYHYALVPYRVGFDVATPIDETYNYGALSSFPTASIPLVTTIDELTTGVAASPLSSSSVTQAILGFSITSNGNPNFTAINIQVTSSALNKFTNAYLYESGNNSFGSDNPVLSVSDNLTGTEIQLSGFSVPLGSVKYFFIVVDIQDTVSASSPTLAPSFTNANITISGGGTVTVNSSPITGTTYSFVDNSPPTISSTVPADNATGVSVLLNQFTITFNEPVLYIGDNTDDLNMIRIRDLDASAGAGAFVDTIPVLNIGVSGNVVTFTTSYALDPNTDYAIRIGSSVFEDLAGNDYAGILTGNNTAWNFQTENIPTISSLRDEDNVGAVTARCIGDTLTINGARFTGTGGVGTAEPTITIDGVSVVSGDIISYSSSQIKLRIAANITSGDIVIFNNDSDLESAGSALTVNPQINTALSVTQTPASPGQGQAVTFAVPSAQNNYTYTLFLDAAPGAITTGQKDTDNSLPIDDLDGIALTDVGEYDFRIAVSRTGCTTRDLTAALDIEILSLKAIAEATDTTACVGTPFRLIGSFEGGAGYYQFSWTGPVGFTPSNSPSPEVTPTDSVDFTGEYILKITDSNNLEVTDTVYIQVYNIDTVSIVPAPGQTSLKTNYTIDNSNPVQLYGSPAGGTFSGQGVAKVGSEYFFTPSNAGLGKWLMTYTLLNANDCASQDTVTFEVTPNIIENLNNQYCQGVTSDADLTLIPGTDLGTRKTYSRLAFGLLRYFSRTCYRFVFTCDLFGCYNTLVPYDCSGYDWCAIGGPAGYSQTCSETGYPLSPGIDQPVNHTYYDAAKAKDTTIVFQRPADYDIDISAIRAYYPGETKFAILVFARDNNNNEVLVAEQPFEVLYNNPNPSIVGFNNFETVCSDSPIIPLSSSESGYTVTDFDIFPITYDAAMTGTMDEEFDPSLVPSSNYEELLVIGMDYNDFNNCPNTVYGYVIWVQKPSPPVAPDVEYCQTTSPSSFKITMTPDPYYSSPTPKWYSADPVSSPSTALDSTNLEFTAPGINGTSPGTEDFFVTQSYRGCEGDPEEVNITILAAPTASFSLPPICEDRDFTIKGPLDGSSNPYDTYIWDFGDGTIDTLNNVDSVTYNYGINTANTQKTIKLNVVNNLDCQNSSFNAATIGQNPIPDFLYNFVCDGDTTEFTGTSDILVTRFDFDFGDGTVTSDTLGSPTLQFTRPHKFSTASTYYVTVTAYTGTGCSNPKSDSVTILPFLTHTTPDPYDMTAIDGGRGYWDLVDLSPTDNSTWTFKLPTSSIMSKFPSSAWVTNGSGNYNPAEESVINSPCFDISGIERPVLSMNFIMNSDEGRDGLVLEWSKNGGVNWFPLGGEDSGLNWFNTPGFTVGTIGSSAIGWSGNSWELEEKDTLTQVRRALDNIGALSQADRANVRFRVAFKSNFDTEFEGFGFNNVRIESRNRISLVENFTNESDPDYTTNNTNYTSIPLLETAKIQYHLGYPDDDDNFNINTADPSARAAYYGIPLTDQFLPRGYVDGANGVPDQPLLGGGIFSPFTSGWVNVRFAKQGLKVSPYALTASTLNPSDPSYLKVLITVKADVDIPASNKPILHIAAVEKTVGTNEFVLRKLIPSAIGRLIPTMVQNDSIAIIDSVRLENPLIDVTDIAIVAFIQDENTREVYQAAIDSLPTYLPNGLITKTEDPTYAERIELFPNPANHELNIQLPYAVVRNTPVVLFDAYGRSVYQNVFTPGELNKPVNTSGLTGGVYIVQIGTPDGGVARRKVMVVHQ